MPCVNVSFIFQICVLVLPVFRSEIGGIFFFISIFCVILLNDNRMSHINSEMYCGFKIQFRRNLKFKICVCDSKIFSRFKPLYNPADVVVSFLWSVCGVLHISHHNSNYRAICT